MWRMGKMEGSDGWIASIQCTAMEIYGLFVFLDVCNGCIDTLILRGVTLQGG
jgi:hypothetical protein